MSSVDPIAEAFRSERRRVLATLVRLLGDLDLAEEALQEAFEIAAQRWHESGVPENPRAWLISTARFRGIDELRRRTRGDAVVRELADAGSEPVSVEDRHGAVQDDQLRLLFICCHPALPTEARVALALRVVCGLSTDEIARGFLVSSETMKRRITRAKAHLRDQRVEYEIPTRDQLGDRLGGVLQVIYLVFNEGYSASAGDEHIRRELTRQALILSRLVVELLPNPEALGLLALLLLHESRSDARVDARGDIIPLEAQDRSRWRRDLIHEATGHLEAAFLSGRIGPYSVQAAIASVHAAAESVETTNWALIVDYYDMLSILQPGPVIQLQRAVALGMRDGPEVGLARVDELLEGGALDRYHSIHAIRADFARRLGRRTVAAEAYRRAIELAQQEPERRYLRRRLEETSK